MCSTVNPILWFSSAFAFMCKAFVGVTPSVALLRHFFSLELVIEVQCSGCVSLKGVDATIAGALYGELLPEAEGFRRQWVQVETAEAGALFQPPQSPATPNRGREQEELSDPRLAPVLIRLEKLRRAGGDDGDGGARVYLSSDCSSSTPLLPNVGLHGA
ncbi:hypothetical protein D1007_59812 [Hordeum vulgare]|nr:hypothetical protein D1007_59812 [Hordeum vulgare]